MGRLAADRRKPQGDLNTWFGRVPFKLFGDDDDEEPHFQNPQVSSPTTHALYIRVAPVRQCVRASDRGGTSMTFPLLKDT